MTIVLKWMSGETVEIEYESHIKNIQHLSFFLKEWVMKKYGHSLRSQTLFLENGKNLDVCHTDEGINLNDPIYIVVDPEPYAKEPYMRELPDYYWDDYMDSLRFIDGENEYPDGYRFLLWMNRNEQDELIYYYLEKNDGFWERKIEKDRMDWNGWTNLVREREYFLENNI